MDRQKYIYTDRHTDSLIDTWCTWTDRQADRLFKRHYKLYRPSHYPSPENSAYTLYFGREYWNSQYNYFNCIRPVVQCIMYNFFGSFILSNNISSTLSKLENRRFNIILKSNLAPMFTVFDQCTPPPPPPPPPRSFPTLPPRRC